MLSSWFYFTVEMHVVLCTTTLMMTDSRAVLRNRYHIACGHSRLSPWLREKVLFYWPLMCIHIVQFIKSCGYFFLATLVVKLKKNCTSGDILASTRKKLEKISTWETRNNFKNFKYLWDSATFSRWCRALLNVNKTWSVFENISSNPKPTGCIQFLELYTIMLSIC